MKVARPLNKSAVVTYISVVFIIGITSQHKIYQEKNDKIWIRSTTKALKPTKNLGKPSGNT